MRREEKGERLCILTIEHKGYLFGMILGESGEISPPQEEGVGNYIETEVEIKHTNYYRVAYHKKAPSDIDGGSKSPTGIKDWNAGIITSFLLYFFNLILCYCFQNNIIIIKHFQYAEFQEIMDGMANSEDPSMFDKLSALAADFTYVIIISLI